MRTNRKIIVLLPFTEMRTQTAYAVGDEIVDPIWHDPDLRRMEAYRGRGLVSLEIVPEYELNPPQSNVGDSNA